MEKLEYRLITFVFFMLIIPRTYAYEFYIADPAPEEYKKLDIEFFESSFNNDQYRNITPSIQAYYGIFPNLDIEILLTYVRHTPYTPGLKNAYGIGDTTLISTYCFLQESQFLPQMSLEPAYLIPTGDQRVGLGNGKPTFSLPLYAQKNWGAWKIVLGLGYTYNTEPLTLNYFYGGVRIGYDPMENLHLGAEVYRQGATANTSNFTEISPNNIREVYLLTAGTYTLLNVGGEYRLTKHLALAASIGKNMDGAKTYATYLGIDYSF